LGCDEMATLTMERWLIVRRTQTWAMRNPTKLRRIPAAEDLAVETYSVTAAFPASERFGLTAQIRRAAVSVGSNVVEGSQRQGNRALLASLHQALGSAAEMQFQLRVASRLEFGDRDRVQAWINQATHIQRMTVRLITAPRVKGD
jgi:four helix bundle protein